MYSFAENPYPDGDMVLFDGLTTNSLDCTVAIGDEFEASAEISCKEDGVESVEIVEESDKTVDESVPDDENDEVCKFANDNGL